jgi:anti-sigma28 factor (negative regulator of flagellin synthesis)
MNRKQSPKICVGVIPEKRRNKLAGLKNAIREGSYKVKVEDIAEKILKELQIELGLIFYNHRYQQRRDN